MPAAMKASRKASKEPKLSVIPEMLVVPMLASIVEKALFALFMRVDDDFFQCVTHVGEAFDDFVAFYNIGVVVFVMVEFQCLGGHVGIQRVIGVWQFGEGESGHVVFSLKEGCFVPFKLMCLWGNSSGKW
jgi:hypothetical protein